MYGKAKFDSVNEVRHLMPQSKYDGDISVKSLKSGAMDLARFPPSKACHRNMLPEQIIRPGLEVIKL